MGSANAVKKLDAEIKRSKEEVENMDLRRVTYIPSYKLQKFEINTYILNLKCLLIYNFGFRLQQCEEDKLTKDSQIRALKQESTAQEELFSKLQR